MNFSERLRKLLKRVLRHFYLRVSKLWAKGVSCDSGAIL